MNIVDEYEDSISDGTVYFYGLNRTHNSIYYTKLGKAVSSLSPTPPLPQKTK